jgi:hypothetical protein
MCLSRPGGAPLYTWIGVMAAAGLLRQSTGLVVSLLRGGDFLWGVP